MPTAAAFAAFAIVAELAPGDAELARQRRLEREARGLDRRGRDGGGVVDPDLDAAFRVDQAGAAGHHPAGRRLDHLVGLVAVGAEEVPAELVVRQQGGLSLLVGDLGAV